MNKSIKQIIKLFIPPFFLRIKGFLKKSKMKDFYSDIGTIKKCADKLLILGNGPSLKSSLQKYMSSFKRGDYDILVVNNIVYDDCYGKIKPRFHMYFDPNLFAPLETLSEFLKIDAEKFVSTFLKKINWDVYFIVPISAKDSWVIDRIKENTYIHPIFINNYNFATFNSKEEKFKLWDKNLIGVPAQTVLNTCLYFGIAKRYKEIYLFGADTNWIEQIRVDQNTNQVYTIDEHFYGKVTRPLFNDVEGKIPSRLHEELYSCARASESYWDLKAYADYAGVKVYNASEYSLIDAFERKKLSSD